jgi:UDP-N-acetylmuramate dehydrogenase
MVSEGRTRGTASETTASETTANEATASDARALERVAGVLGARAIRNAPLGARTTYRVGGPAAVLVEATDEMALGACHDALATVGRPVPVLVIGRGSNMLVADAGFPGLVIALAGEFEVSEMDRATETVLAGGAVGMQALARETARAGLTGFEWAVGIPGSIGGAIRMNAGGHGSQMADVLRWATVFDLESGSAVTRSLVELETGYRRSAVRPADVVVRAELRLTSCDTEGALEKVREVVRWRTANQPGGFNAGSVFTNPPGDSAGRLIDSAGLKGMRHGSAAVSEKHANFFQAERHGSADDVRALIDEVRAAVLEHQGIDLVPELCLVGFPGIPLPTVQASGKSSTSTRGSGARDSGWFSAPSEGRESGRTAP